MGTYLRLLTILPGLLMADAAFAEDAPVTEVAYILNTFLFLITGVLVMLMAAGFAMLEAGMVRNKSVAVILVKNISLYSLAGVMFYLVGYNLMYNGVDGGFFGIPGIWSPDDSAAAAGDYSANYAATSDWFFQMVFVATAASIVSGALAERIKIWPFMAFVAVLTGVIYPITGSWVWGGGWLKEMGFSDFAGSTLVHSVGGWAALAGAILLGARNGRFSKEGKALPMPGTSLPQVALGTFLLWFGWFGFNGGSQLALGTASDAIAISKIFANTNMAAAAGVMTIMLITQLLYKKIDAGLLMNGALAGLVSITAEPLTPSIGEAIMIGSVGAVIMMVASKALEKCRIDDVVGAVPVHLAAGIWGTIAVAFTNPDTSFGVQATGVLAIGGFTMFTSFIIWLAFKATVGIRLDSSKEEAGCDLSELGTSAYNMAYSK